MGKHEAGAKEVKLHFFASGYTLILGFLTPADQNYLHTGGFQVLLKCLWNKRDIMRDIRETKIPYHHFHQKEP